jgi:thiol-disulfide isomerase/thioredoxin
MAAKIGSPAPNLHVSEWVQGKPTNLDSEKGNVVLVEVFQVNCPGCFLYGIPEAIDLYSKYREEGLTILGLATAFEDFDKNNLENLRKLVTTGEVVGETLNALSQYGQLKEGGKLPFKIPFPVGMDLLRKDSGALTESKIMDFVEEKVPEFRSYNEKERQELVQRVKQYLQGKEFSALTFEEYALRGTPSSIVVDRKGVLRSTSFGSNGYLEGTIKDLLEE